MDFRISEDAQALVEGVRDYLNGAHGPEVLRALDATESRRSAQIWGGLVEMGLPGLLVPEDQGGLGLTLVDGVLIAIELGRAAVAEPLADTALVAVPLLAKAAGQGDLLSAIAGGEAIVALQHPVNPWVADLEQATHLLSATASALTLSPFGLSWSKPRPSSLEVQPFDKLRANGGGRIESVDPLRCLYPPVEVQGQTIGTPDDLLNHAALITAAQLQGLSEAMLAIATDYAQNRNQFGQPIGGFQAIKHLLANVAVKTEFARPVVLRAAQALQEGLASAPVHVSHAKIVTGEAAILAAETAIQVHGAMGYTYEVDLHFWMKRAWALAGAWGDRAYHLARLDKAVIGGGLRIGPAHSFD